MPLASGTLLGPYQIEATLGAGGMGEVYKATDTRLDRTVAIKVLPEHVASDPDVKQRFKREAKTVAALSHPHICPVFDVGEQDGVNYLVMEYLDGETLTQRLEEGALPLDQALQIAIEIADSLDKAHRQGIVHRDLKPGNIMLTKAGAKLLDFGLAKLRPDGTDAGVTGAPTQSANLTGEGSILGTLQYMAPEQLEGRESDSRTDIFAFGGVVYEMVTGTKAFGGTSQASLIAAILEHDPVSMSSLQPLTPTALDRVVRTCVAKDPDDRWQSMTDLGREVRWISETDSSPTGAASGADRAQRAIQRRSVRTALVTAVVTGAIVGVAVWSITRSGTLPGRGLARFEVRTPDEGLLRGGMLPELAISPDGTHIVWSSLRSTANPSLYIRSMDQLQAIPLRGANFGHQPFFAPDGERVGFVDARVDSLNYVSTSGGPAVTICEVGEQIRGVSWGSDGTIVFGTGAPSGLWRVAASGGEPQPLTTVDVEEDRVNHVWPHVLPEGRAVLFTVISGGAQLSDASYATTSPVAADRAEIAVVDLNTGDQTLLLPTGSNPRYSPTGHIVYGVDGTLWAVGFDADRLELTTEPVPVLENVNTKASGAASFGLSATGAIAYVPGTVRDLRDTERRLVWVDREGNEDTALDAGYYQQFRLAPDGMRVAVTVNRDLWLYDLPRGTPTRLTFDPVVMPSTPTWTPDGLRVAFSFFDGARPPAWKAADGTGDVERIADRARMRPLDFSSDSTVLIFELGRHLGVLSLRGDGLSTVWDFEHAERNADLSPDGRWLAYESNETGQFEVFVRPFPEATAGSLPSPPPDKWQVSQGGGGEPLWHPGDGQELFYVGPEGVVAVTISTEPTFRAGRPERLFDMAGYALPSAPGANRRMDVARDGTRFLLLKDIAADADSCPEIVLIQNWSEDVQRLVPTP